MYSGIIPVALESSLGGNMYPGIIPFGSGHASVALESSLTSLASITGVTRATGSAAAVDSTNTYDARLGMIGGAKGGAKFLALTDAAALSRSGQFSIDVEAEWLASVSGGGTGYAPPENEFLFHTIGKTSNNSAECHLYKSTQAAVKPAFLGFEMAFHHQECTSNRAGRFITVTFSWIGGEFSLYYDGNLISTKTFTPDYVNNMMANFYVGCQGKTAAPYFFKPITSHYIRNLVLSTQPVMIPMHPQGAVINWSGDSFVVNAFSAFSYPTAPWWDMRAEWVIKAYLARRGIGVDLNMCGNSGDQVTIGGAGGDISDLYTTIIANNPSIILVQCGTNDATDESFDAEQFTTDYKAHIDYFINNVPNLKAIILGDVPSMICKTTNNTTSNQARRLVINGLIDDLQSYSPLIARAYVSAALGENPEMYLGGVSGAYDNLYPASLGQQAMGEAYAKAIYAVLGR